MFCTVLFSTLSTIAHLRLSPLKVLLLVSHYFPPFLPVWAPHSRAQQHQRLHHLARLSISSTARESTNTATRTPQHTSYRTHATLLLDLNDLPMNSAQRWLINRQDEAKHTYRSHSAPSRFRQTQAKWETFLFLSP